MKNKKKKIKNFTVKEVYEYISSLKEPNFRAKQLLDWIYEKKVSDFEEMTNIPLALRNRLKEDLEINTLTLADMLSSEKDDTIKFLYQLEDGEVIETVVMKHDYGNTVCISSQVGCKMGCSFCASTAGGYVRDLTSGEMLDQVIISENYLSASEKIKNIVVMGMGEPLLNYSNLLRFLKLANDPLGLDISFRNITVSTVGIVPGIYELAKEKLPLTLAISLHAPDNLTRSRLIPINEKYPIEEVITACEKFINSVNRRITFEYILIEGVNDTHKQALELASLIKGMLCHVNLIPANPVGGLGHKGSSREKLKNFYDILENEKIPVSIRKERGTDIEGACGQLRRRYLLRRGSNK